MDVYTSMRSTLPSASTVNRPPSAGFGKTRTFTGAGAATRPEVPQSQRCAPRPVHVLTSSVSHSRSALKATGGRVTPPVTEGLRIMVWFEVSQAAPSPTSM